MAFLESLLANRAKEVLGSVAVGEYSHREVAVMSEYVEVDYHGRFLIELLQNANDQATKAEKWDATVTVIRESGLVAVANQGEPLDAEGVRSLTSLGLSPKDPNQLIGNKGIGFKAVFEVSRSPEIYSAPGRSQSFQVEGGFAFQISRDVFTGEQGQRRLDDLVTLALSERPADAQSLGDDPRQRLGDEIRKAAPFKFPVPLTRSAAIARFAAIADLPQDTQALVVLPLLEDESTTDVVNRAVDELLADEGAMVLFLPGIARVHVIDRVRDICATIAKERHSISGLQDGAQHAEMAISVKRDSNPPVVGKWQMVESVYGGDEQPEQSCKLNAAAKKLPGTRYDTVERVPVAVALRQPTIESTDFEQPVSGRICIGLPTLDLTGTPAWVHSHFFGSISRKDVDLRTSEFNRLLFEEAVRLHGLLVARLKASESLDDRRLVSLAFDRSNGPLADEFLSDGGQATGEIVLLEDGKSYAKAEHVLIGAPEDIEMISKIISASSRHEEDPGAPDCLLARRANDLLWRLADAFGHALDEADSMLTPNRDGRSMLERAATAFRSEGHEFWEPFLLYCLELDPGLTRLRKLKIIPVANNRIASADDGVFLPPSAAGIETTDDDSEQDEVHGELLAGLPRGVADRLNLVDVQSLRVRMPESRRLTEFGTRLSPPSGGLIRPTRLYELVNGAIIPAIDELAATEDDLADGLQLLKLAAELMLDMRDDSRARVSVEKLKVPAVSSSAAGWKWVPTTECYFGNGWLGGRQEKLLHDVYAHRDGSVLISWQQVLHVLGDAERDEWRRLLMVAGVNARPRILVSPKRFPAPFYATWEHLQIGEPAHCPIKAAEAEWRQYLEVYRERGTAVHTGQRYTMDRVTWIDGLDEEHASAILEMISQSPAHYEGDLTCTLGREGNTHVDGTTLPSLWVHSLRAHDWPVIPANDNLIHPPSECWIVRGGQASTRQRRYDLLHSVTPSWLNASRILMALGVEDLDSPTIDALLRELGRIGSRANAGEEIVGRALASLAEDLYGRLQRMVGEEASMSAAPREEITLLPLLRDGQIIGLPPADITEAFYLDDPNRAAFVPEIGSKLRWPFSPRAGAIGITRWLRKRLGDRAVLLTSEAHVETGFLPRSRPELFLDWLRQNFPAQQQIVTDLGCLIAYLGPRETDPSKPQFREHWAKFFRATVTIGQFTASPETRIFVETTARTHVDIQASDSLLPLDILSETWRLVGNAYEDAWRLYCFHLEAGAFRAAQFLKEKDITEKDREDVETGIGVTSTERLQRIEAAVFAIRRSQFGDSKEDFCTAWSEHATTVNGIALWLGGPFTKILLTELLAEPTEEAASCKLLDAANVPVSQWQECRQLLGQPRYHFTSTTQLWTKTRNQLAATLKASLARLPGSELELAQPMIEYLAALEPPALMVEAPPVFSAIREALIEPSMQFATRGISRSIEVARSRLQALREIPATKPDELRLIKEPPERDVREFREVAEEVRSRQADERFETYQMVAAALAPRFEESLDSVAFAASGNLPFLRRGYWANRYSLMPVFQNELRKAIPKTFALMMERDAFKSDFTPNELRGLFPELLSLDGADSVKPPRKLSLAGIEIDETELDRELALGSSGLLGAALTAAASGGMWDVSWLNADRETLAPVKRKERGTRKRGERKPPRESESDKQVNGILGEIVVFEWLKRLGIPAFDGQCWISSNRCQYTGYAEGDDTAGCDFIVEDADGLLTGRADHLLCLIEVKATAGDGQNPFKITENEWQRATDAHFNEREEFFIVRVGHVRTSPAIVDVLRDPYALMTQSKLRFVGGDLTAQVGSRTK